MWRLAVFFALLMGSQLATAQSTDSTGVVEGTVYSAIDSAIVPGANVVVLRGDSVVSSTAADRSGRFRLVDLSAGDYRIRTSMICFKTTSTALSFANGTPQDLSLYVGRMLPPSKLLFGAEEARRDIAQGKIEFALG